MTKQKAKRGAPAFIWTKELESEIIRRVAGGDNLDKITSEDAFPSKPTVYKKLLEDTDFANEYARAREARADARSDRIDDIVRRMIEREIPSDVARVAIDAEKWQAGKENTKRYGDRMQVDARVEDVTQRTDAEVEAGIAKLAGKAGIAVALRGAGTAEEPKTD